MVSSTGEVVLSLFSLIEYLLIVEVILVASFGLRYWRMDSPVQEVRILVFKGLTKHPFDTSNLSISV